MIENPHVAEVAAQQTAAVRLVVPTVQIKEVMGPGISEVFASLAAQGIEPAGPWLTFHYRRPTDTFDFEIAVPVARPVAPVGRVAPGSLPAGRVARATYRGPYEGLAAAWGAFHEWVARQGHAPKAEMWECYAVGPESGDDPKGWRTELYQPLA